MGIKRNKVAEPQWDNWDYAERVKHDLFSSERWKETMDWNTILEHVKRMENACQMIETNYPTRLFCAYADLLEANLYILDDLFYFLTGVRIGSGEGYGMISAYLRLRFWNMGFYKEMEAIAEGLDRIEQHFKDCLQKFGYSGRAYDYAYAAYDGEEEREDKNQVENIIGFLENHKQLFYNFDKTIEFAKFNGLVAQYRQSKKGQDFIKPWRRDFTGTRDSLIAKLEKDPKLGSWVNKCTHLREDEDAIVQLFCDDIGFLTNKEESCNVDNWLNILTVAAVLQEYDEQHGISSPVPTGYDKEADDELMLKLSLYFKDDDTAKRFLKSVRDMKNDTEIITLVKKHRDAKICTDTSKKLWKILHDANIYKAQYRNWMGQLNR
jgi:hypothetical protein